MKYIPPGLVVVIVGMTLTSLSTIVVALRYYCRHFLMGSVGLSDHLMLTALLITWGNTVINYYQYQFSQASRPSQLRGPDRRLKAQNALAGTLLTWWIYRITYMLGLCFAKLSILFFFRAIATRSTFRRVVWATIIFVSLSTIAVTIGSIFQCERPADAFSVVQWASQFNPDLPRGKCFQPTILWVFSAAINLLTDVIILLLPIPTLLGLRVPISKRLALVGIFSVGIMAIVASCVRMWIMALWSESIRNSSRFGAELLLWGQVEVNAGIVSASVPFLRLLFTRSKAPIKDMEGPPVQMRNVNNKPLELNSHQIFGGPDKGPNGSPIWKPFITVPASLSSRDSVTMVDTSGHHSNRSHTATI